jgi:hypothetical protein
MRATFWAPQARWLMLTIARPGGAAQAFCEAVATTSRPHSSVRTSMPTIELTASTMRSASVWRTTAAISRSGLVTPVDDSLWVTSTAFVSGCARRCRRTASGSTPLPAGNSSFVTVAP